MKKMKSVSLTMAVAALLIAGTSTSGALASQASDMQDRVDQALAGTPGGVQTSWNEVTWDGGDVVLTLAPTTTSDAFALAAVANCADGSFCVYSLGSYTGDKLTFSTCTSNHNVAPLGSAVRSMANSRSTGVIRAFAGATLLASAAAGTGTNVGGTTVYVTCS